MIVFVIDPGHSTGIFVARIVAEDVEQSKKLCCLTLEGYEQKKLADMLEMYRPDIILVERSPKFFGRIEQAEWVKRIISTIREYSDKATLGIYAPGDYKPIAKAQKWRHPRAKTAHEADAFNLLRYWVLSTYKKLIPYL